MTGWYVMHRGWQDSAVFRDTEYSERDAWIWLIENAVHKDTTVEVMGSPTQLKRGQLSYSIRYLSEAWKWHRRSVERFLNKLKKWDMIRLESGTGQIIITICKYEKYQSQENETGTGEGQKAGQERDRRGTNKNNDNNDKQINNKDPELKNSAGGEIPDRFDDFFKIYPNPTGIGAARQAWNNQIFLYAADPDQIIAATKAYAAKNLSTEKKWIPKPDKFLTDQTYLDPDLTRSAKFHDTKSLEDWQRKIASRIGVAATHAWFGDAVMRKDQIVFPTKMKSDYVRTHYQATLNDIIGGRKLVHVEETKEQSEEIR